MPTQQGNGERSEYKQNSQENPQESGECVVADTVVVAQSGAALGCGLPYWALALVRRHRPDSDHHRRVRVNAHAILKKSKEMIRRLWFTIGRRGFLKEPSKRQALTSRPNLIVF